MTSEELLLSNESRYKKILILGLACVLGLMTACSKQEGAASQQATASQQDAAASVPQRTFTQRPGVSLYPGTPLYRENAEGKMVYADEVVKGEVLSIYYDASTNQIEEKEAIRLLSSGKEDTMNFVMVAFDGGEYWTRDIFVARESDSACTVIEEEYIYSSPENIGITSEKISAGDMLAVNLNQEPQNGFMEVTIYNGKPYGRQVFLQESALITSVEDVTAIKAMSRLKELAANPDAKLKPEVELQMEELVSDMAISPAVWNYLFGESLQ